MRTINMISAARVATACAAALVLAACGAPLSTPVSAGTAQPTELAGTPPPVIRPTSTNIPLSLASPVAVGTTPGITGREWMLVEDSVHGRVPTGVRSTVRFLDGGKLAGNGGCNGFGGNYTVSGTNIKIDQLVSTLMACKGPGGDQEQWYFAALGKAVRYELAGNQLRIFYGDGKAFLTFTA